MKKIFIVLSLALCVLFGGCAEAKPEYTSYIKIVNPQSIVMIELPESFDTGSLRVKAYEFDERHHALAVQFFEDNENE